jgi:hypothetical protein
MRVAGWFLVSALCTVGIAHAQTSPAVQTSINIDFASKYAWHGLDLVNDWVAQPSVSVSTSRLNLTVWGNLELTAWNAGRYPFNPRDHITEIDSSLEYDDTWRGHDWSVGYIDRQFPRTGNHRYKELYVSSGDDKVWGSPRLTLNTSASARTGSYATLALSYSMKCPAFRRSRSMDLGAEITFGDEPFNDFLYGHNAAGFSDVHLSFGTGCEMRGGWTFTPTLHYSLVLHDHVIGQSLENVWLDLGLAYSF